MKHVHPIEHKLLLLEGVKTNDVDKCFGITPDDYKIFGELGKIDLTETGTNFKIGQHAGRPGDRDTDSDGEDNHAFHSPADLDVDNYLIYILNKCVICG